MKTSLLIGLVATSIVGNAMLYRTLSTRNASPKASTSSATATADQAPIAPPVPSWDSLETADINTLPNRLRSAGLPPKMVAAITTARIGDQYAQRRREIMTRNPFPYWSRFSMQEFSGGKAMRDLTREQRQAYRAALGEDATNPLLTPEQIAAQQRTYGPLPTEKISRIQEISSDYSELRMAIQAEAGGLLLAEDRAKLALLAEEERADLQALLTPEEYEDYQLRRSPSANQLRSQLLWLEVNEQEFRSLYRLQEAYNNQYSSMTAPTSPSANAAQRRAAEQALIAEAKTILGEERGAEFERSRDGSYRQLASLIDRLALPRSAAQEVISVQRDIQSRVSAVVRNQGLSPDERLTQIGALTREATESITAHLGPEGFTAYRQSVGFWLNSLEPRTGAQPVPGR